MVKGGKALEKNILFRRGIKRQKGSLIGISLLVFFTVISLFTVLAVSLNGNAYIRSEMERAGFGQLTAWVSDVPDVGDLLQEISSQEGIGEVQSQNIIFSEYEGNGIESDSEGQLILWQPGETRYRFLNDDMGGYRQAPEEIRQGEVYVSPSMVSIMDLQVGDTITFPVARGGMNVDLTVAGYYEDPFMGSSMIGMKGFLISGADYGQIIETVEQEGADALARSGAMLHIFVQADGEAGIDQINQLLNSQTSLPEYAEEIHSAYTIGSFMMILQNAFCAILAAFALILLLVAMVVLGHSISGIVEQEQKNMGILKTLGVTGRTLVFVQEMEYLAAIILGSIMGTFAVIPFTRVISAMTVTTTGLLIPSGIPVLPCLGVFSVILLLLGGYAALRMQRILHISPMEAIRDTAVFMRSESRRKGKEKSTFVCGGIQKNGLVFHLAVRQLLSGRKRYLSACLVACFLVFFASLAGRMNSWLGTDGQGMMDAFNPADLDLGVQAMGELSEEEMEAVVRSYSMITDRYDLAMPTVSVNGTNYTANVITEPERFHISRGETCMDPDEVVLTEVTAADLGVDVGSTVMIRGDMGSREYTVSGIYHCANDMGANLGMSREGYLSIGQDEPRIWCHHYFLEDPFQKEAITSALETAYGGDVHVHQNTWPGLSGIITAMHLSLAFMYGMIAVFIAIVTAMAGKKILNAEQRDLAIYRSIGCSAGMLQVSFAIRFGITAFAGAVAGTICAAVLTDPFVSAVMRLAGISNFASHPAISNLLVPGAAVTLLFFASAWLLAVKIRRTDMNVLTAE